jgi:Cu/Ag efflux protein CusF
MMRTLVCAALALTLAGGIALGADKGVKKGQTVTGTIKKVDAAAGTITLTIKSKKETIEKEFKVADTTRVVVFAGTEKKELSGKDGLKAEQLKEGTQVAVVTDAEGKVTEIRIGNPPKKEKK